MKKALVILLISTGIISSCASANTQYYIEGQSGYGLTQTGTIQKPPGDYKKEQKHLAWRITIGEIMPLANSRWSIMPQIGYFYSPETKYQDQRTGSSDYEKFYQNAIDGLLGISYAVTPILSIEAKGGYAIIRQTRKTGHTENKTTLLPEVGIGINYQISYHISATVNYYRTINGDKTAETVAHSGNYNVANSQSIMAGVRYKF